MSLTNPNTPVSQQDLKDLYEQKILPYMGGSFGLVATGIDSSNLYSTTERVIGQWIDGKPLYQRVVDCGTLTTKPDTYIPVSGSSEMNVVNMHGFIDMNGVVEPLPYVHDTELKLMIAVKFSKSAGINIFARDNTSISGFHAYVTLQYTKTTDSAVESYGTDTTYSTDEHVVGSWIDGKPVYQKTITGTAPSSSSTQNIQIGANVESALVIGGYCRHDSFLTPINAQVDTNEYLMVWVRNNSHPTVPNTLGIKAGSALYGGSYNITLQYTKPSST